MYTHTAPANADQLRIRIARVKERELDWIDDFDKRAKVVDGLHRVQEGGVVTRQIAFVTQGCMLYVDRGVRRLGSHYEAFHVSSPGAAREREIMLFSACV